MTAFTVDLETLTRAFADKDARTPGLTFGLFGLFFERGPFPFEANVLSSRLNETNLKARINPEELASLQQELETFFEATHEGWVPSGRLFRRA